MVAKFHQTRSIINSLMYNENKVELGVAQCIYAGNLILNANELNLQMKREFLKLWSTLNVNIHINCVHMSLSFHPKDKDILDENLPIISAKFMELIGFGDQPYLVYQHKDTSIPHAHIVSTNVINNGKRMDTFYICQKKFIPAIKKLENDFGLTSYAHEKHIPYQHQSPNQVLKYGTRPTKKSIEEVTLHMMKNYSFTNFEEWSSLLKIYNIKASLLPINEKRNQPGILYTTIDHQTNKPKGMPIKASELEGKPTYKTLNTLYKQNSLNLKQENLKSKVAVELMFIKGIINTKSELINELGTRGIHAVFSQDSTDQSETVCYIDLINHCVINERKLAEENQFKNLIDPESESKKHKQKKLRRGLRPKL